MFQRPAFLLIASTLALVVAQGCSDSDDDGCPGCQPVEGGSTFPPTAPIIEGQPPPATGGASSGGTGGLGATGGVIATGGTQGGTFTGGVVGF